MLFEDGGLQDVQGLVGAELPGLGHHLAAATPEQRDLVDADLQHVDLVFLRVDVIESRLQHVAADALLLFRRKLAVLGLLAGERGDNPGVTDRNRDGIDDLDVVAIRVHAVFARTENPAPDPLLAALGDELPLGELAAYLGGDDGHLARIDDGDAHNLPLMEQRVEEMASFAQGLLPDALLAGPGQDLPRFKRLAAFSGDNGHLVGPDVKAAEAPQPDELRENADGKKSQDTHENFHLPPPLPTAVGAGTKEPKMPPRPPSESPLKTDRTCGPSFS
ncbi:MAG: hypothetical protein ACD_75C02025G0002 [uncultured bacterium]|nr:MAG: hypothetical protein ACD_75C02025G0002 [uncultured bacterium]